ncbi:hypothetical protein [Streptomyces hydrogenans]|uniref:hypothetical protein n=1 Tax=Streptomyces hydrogenans TaxID=1873719 RepID=UPI00381D9ABD
MTSARGRTAGVGLFDVPVADATAVGDVLRSASAARSPIVRSTEVVMTSVASKGDPPYVPGATGTTPLVTIRPPYATVPPRLPNWSLVDMPVVVNVGSDVIVDPAEVNSRLARK